MSELTTPQVQELLRDLLDLKVQLEQGLAAGAADTRPVALDLPIGRLSRMDAIQQQNMAQANRRGAELRLAQVKIALAAVDEGEFGFCRECGEDIGYPRLKARPEAPFCMECQSRREGRGR